MAYMRGEYHVWNDSHSTHFRKKGEEIILLPNNVLDEFVVMRYAQFTKSQITKIEKRAVKKHYGNFSCDALAKKYNKNQ